MVTPDHFSIRVVTVYATDFDHREAGFAESSASLDLGQLTAYYEFYRDQLPRLLPVTVAACEVGLEDSTGDIGITETDVLIFALPSDQVIVAVVLGLRGERWADRERVAPMARALDELIEGRLHVNGLELADFLAASLGAAGSRRSEPGASPPLLPERHQLVFIPRDPSGASLADDVVEGLTAREMAAYRDGVFGPRRPEELNQPPNLAVVTRYTSLVHGHDRLVEDSILLSTVQAVGAASRYRQLWQEAYAQVRQFREAKHSTHTGWQTRDDLEALTDTLGALELDFTFAAGFPLRRIEGFESALHDKLELNGQARAMEAMFDQLGGSVRHEITAIDIRERRRGEARTRWNAVATGVLCIVVIPVLFVLLFLATNTAEVSADVSMWSSRYTNVYFLAGLFALAPVYLIIVPYLRDYAAQSWRRRAGWLGPTLAAAGGLLLSATYLEGKFAIVPVITALIRSVSVFVVMSGLTLVLFALRRVRWR